VDVDVDVDVDDHPRAASPVPSPLPFEPDMRTAARLLVLVACLAAVTCGGPPKQAEAPDVTDDKGADMQGQDPNAADPNKTGTEEVKASEADMHAKCCEQCKEGMAKDRSGAKADAVPCADFTDVLKPWCLEHFRSKPTMAAACK